MSKERLMSPSAWLMLLLLVVVTLGFLEMPEAGATQVKAFHGPVAPAYHHGGPLHAC